MREKTEKIGGKHFTSMNIFRSKRSGLSKERVCNRERKETA